MGCDQSLNITKGVGKNNVTRFKHTFTCVQNYVKVNPNTFKRVLILGVGVPQCHKSLEQGLGDQTLSKLGEENGDSSQVWTVVHLMKI